MDDGISTVSEETYSGGTGTLRTKRILYSLENSQRLMVGHEIQRELEDAQTEESELEQIGKQMEKFLRGNKLGIYKNCMLEDCFVMCLYFH